MKDILKQFNKGDRVLRVDKESERLRVLFGTFQGGFEQGSVSMPGVPGGSFGRSMTFQAQGDRKKAFFGFLNPFDLTIFKQPGNIERIQEFEVNKRVQQVFDEEKVSELISVIRDNYAYIIYILKRDKELVIEKFE